MASPISLPAAAASSSHGDSVSDAQVAFVVECYLRDNHFSKTLKQFRSEASRILLPMKMVPKGARSLVDVLNEYVCLKAERMCVNNEKARMQHLFDGLQEILAMYQSGTPYPAKATPAVASDDEAAQILADAKVSSTNKRKSQDKIKLEPELQQHQETDGSPDVAKKPRCGQAEGSLEVSDMAMNHGNHGPEQQKSVEICFVSPLHGQDPRTPPPSSSSNAVTRCAKQQLSSSNTDDLSRRQHPTTISSSINYAKARSSKHLSMEERAHPISKTQTCTPAMATQSSRPKASSTKRAGSKCRLLDFSAADVPKPSQECFPPFSKLVANLLPSQVEDAPQLQKYLQENSSPIPQAPQQPADVPLLSDGSFFEDFLDLELDNILIAELQELTPINPDASRSSNLSSGINAQMPCSARVLTERDSNCPDEVHPSYQCSPVSQQRKFQPSGDTYCSPDQENNPTLAAAH